MIGRADTLTDERINHLRDLLAAAAPDVPVLTVSPKTGFGVTDVIDQIESPSNVGKRLLDIDYDTYAEGEAELGWVNLTATAQPKQSIELDELSQAIVSEIGKLILDNSDGAIAHVKVSISGSGFHSCRQSGRQFQWR